MKFNSTKVLFLIILFLTFSSIYSDTLKTKFEPDPEFDMDVPVVKGYKDKMMKANIFIYNAEQVPKKIVTEDRIDHWQTSFIIYRPSTTLKKLKRKVLTMKKLKFLCGLGKFCTIEDFYSKIGNDQLNVSDMKTKVAEFLAIIGTGKTCFADLYTWKAKPYGVVVCLSETALATFPNMFKSLNPGDFKEAKKSTIPITEKKTFELFITDGHKALKKRNVTFDDEIIMIDGKPGFYYKNIEPYDGEKCKVKTSMRILPSVLISQNFFKANCMVKFYYNKVKTYIAFPGKDCESATQYMQDKMSQSCLRSINGPSNSWKNELVSMPERGRWKGYVFYHKVLDNGGVLSPIPFKFEIADTGITATDKFGTKITTINVKDLNWHCNEDFSCDIDHYIKYLSDSGTENGADTKLKDFKMVSDKIVETWKLQDYNPCFVLEEKDIHIICPTDNSEEANLKSALANSIDNLLQNAPLTSFRTAPVNSVYTLLYTSDSTNTFRQTEVIITYTAMINKSDGKEILHYKNIKEFAGTPCGIDFRTVQLPGQLHEIRPNCCARIKAQENLYFCIDPPSKCYKNLREMINLITKGCLVAQGLKSASSINAFTGSSWTGNVIFSEINNYGNKGMPDIDTGTMSVSQEHVRFDGKLKRLDFKTSTSNFICGDGSLCTLLQFTEVQTPFLKSGVDENWFKMQIEAFRLKAGNLVEVDKDCYVYVSKRELAGDSQAVLHCATDKQQTIAMAGSVPNAFAKALDNIKPTQPDFYEIPTTYDGRAFNAYVIAGTESTDLSTAKPRENKIQIKANSLNYVPSNDIIFNYSDIVFDDKMKYQYGLEAVVDGIPKGLKDKGVNKSCCFKAFTQSKNFWLICFKQYPLCVYQKASTVRFIEDSLNIAKKTKEKTIEDNKTRLNQKLEDSFDFRIKPTYKKFSPGFNIADLMMKNFDNSKNGFWSGWGYHMPLTDRKTRIIQPVYLEIGKGFILVKSDVDAPASVKLSMANIESVCGDEPCSPQKYLDFYSKVNSYANQTFLENAINSCLSQMYRPYRSEACMVIDFTEPQQISGESHMFCSMDSLQGASIRQAVKTNYYLTLLNLNIDTDIRNVVYDVDKFNASLFVDEKFNSNYNTFKLTSQGLVGTYEDPEQNTKPADPNNASSTPETSEPFSVDFGNIAKDFYGKNCGFWYKDLKLSTTRGPEVANEIYDDNCCFRFFREPSNQKIELCVFDYNLRVCVKRMKELMKGLKDGCEEYKKQTMGGIPNATALSEDVADEFSLNTMDDSHNGRWYGYVYMGPVYSPQVTPASNPYYVKITNNWISLFKDAKSSDPFQSIPIDTLNFNCPEFSACRITTFIKRVKTHKEYSSKLGSVNTVVQNYKDKLTDIRASFDKVCTVLETSANSFLLCPYNVNHAVSLNRAIVRGYTIHYNLRKLPTVEDTEPGRVWQIAYMTDSVERKKVYISQKGIIDKESDIVFIPFPSLDKDPVVGSKCAIWIKEVPLAFNFPRKECCFMISMKNKPMTICLEKKGVCIGDTYKFAKQIWNGCMFGQPKISSEVESKIDYRNDICPKLKNFRIFESKELDLDFIQDLYQDIIYSNDKSLYKGWVNVYPIEIDKENSVVSKNLYAEFTPEAFSFYANDKFDSSTIPELRIRPDMLAFTCSRTGPCFPQEFMQNYTTNYNLNFGYYSNILQARIDQFEGSREQGCAVLEYNVNGSNNYFVVCPHIVNTKSEHPKLQAAIEKKYDGTNYSTIRAILSTYYGKILRNIIYNSYKKAKKFTEASDLPVYNTPVKKVKLTFQTLRSEHDQLKITSKGVFSSSVEILKFKDFSNCRIRHNLIYVPKDIILKGKRECCVKYRGPRFAEYMCIDSATCDVDTYRVAYLLNQHCKIVKNLPQDEVINEFNGGHNVDTNKFIKRIKDAPVNGNFQAISKGDQLSSDEYVVKYRSLFVKYLLAAREFLHEAFKQLVEESSRADNTSDDTPDKTPDDDITKYDLVKSFIPLYKGSNELFDFEVGKGGAVRYTDKKTQEMLITIRGLQIVKSKDYKMLLNEKEQYIYVLFDEQGSKISMEIKGGSISVFANAKESYASKTYLAEMTIAEIDK